MSHPDPKALVRAQKPSARCLKGRSGTYGVVVPDVGPTPGLVALYGTGRTARAAWADAARRLQALTRAPTR